MGDMTTPIPEGYMKNGMGHLIPIDLVSDIDRARTDIVTEIAEAAKVMSGMLSEYKQRCMGDILAFVEMSAEKYGKNIGGAKGNITLTTFDGRYKIQLAVQRRIAFNERLQIARNILEELLVEWSEDVRPEVKAIVLAAFDMDTEGNISVAKVIGLRRLNISDPRWLEAMLAIGDSIERPTSKDYIRVYERERNGEYRAISLDVASA